MSVADHEIEEHDPNIEWCDVHQLYYVATYPCGACKDDAADRRYDSMRDERGREK